MWVVGESLAQHYVLKYYFLKLLDCLSEETRDVKEVIPLYERRRWCKAKDDGLCRKRDESRSVSQGHWAPSCFAVLLPFSIGEVYMADGVLQLNEPPERTYWEKISKQLENALFQLLKWFNVSVNVEMQNQIITVKGKIF